MPASTWSLFWVKAEKDGVPWWISLLIGMLNCLLARSLVGWWSSLISFLAWCLLLISLFLCFASHSFICGHRLCLAACKVGRQECQRCSFVFECELFENFMHFATKLQMMIGSQTPVLKKKKNKRRKKSRCFDRLFGHKENVRKKNEFEWW